MCWRVCYSLYIRTASNSNNVGHLGQLTLSIPWTSLSSKPVEILIEDIYLLIAPASNAKVFLLTVPTMSHGFTMVHRVTLKKMNNELKL